jgi:hypothetical protein
LKPLAFSLKAEIESWILELRRILQPDGRLYITVHDKHTMEISQERLKRGEKAKFNEQICQYINTDFGMLVLSSGNYQRGFDAQVFYDIDFICQKWGPMLKILSVTTEAYADQTAILLTKES